MNTPAPTPGKLRIAAKPVIIIATVMMALRFGLNYGIGNHNTYLLHAFRICNPSLLARDWIATQAADYHPVFTYLAWLMYLVDSSGWIFAIFNLLVLSLGGYIIYMIIQSLVEKTLALYTFLLVITMVGLTSTLSLSGSYIFSQTFQPSTVAAVGYLAALVFYFRSRYLVSGLCLAVGGLFHANFLVLAFPLFGLAHLILGRQRLLSRLSLQLAPSLLSALPLIPLILAATTSAGAEEARRIYQQIHAPQHYLPMTFLSQFIPFGCWQLMALLTGKRFFKHKPAGPRLVAIWISLNGIVAIGTLLTTVVFLPVVSQIYVWRLVPFANLLAWIVTAAAAVDYLSGRSPNISAKKTVLLVIAGGLLIHGIVDNSYSEYRKLYIAMPVAVLLLVSLRNPVSYILKSIRWPLPITMTAVLALWLLCSIRPLSDLRSHSSLLRGFSTDESDLYRWAQTTSLQSVFLIPPDLQNFRLHARRAIIVDLKSPPIIPDELLAWYRRLETISGVTGFTDKRQVLQGYKTTATARASDIRSLYPFDYLVVETNDGLKPPSGYQKTFETASFTVFQPPN